MIKKTITYTDYNGNTRTEDFWFNLSKAEVLEMEAEAEASGEGSIEQMYNKIAESKDPAVIMEQFKKLILKSYGEKSADGKRFRKIDDNGRPLSEAFAETEAFVELYMGMLETDSAIEFFNGVFPTFTEVN